MRSLRNERSFRREEEARAEDNAAAARYSCAPCRRVVMIRLNQTLRPATEWFPYPEGHPALAGE